MHHNFSIEHFMNKKTIKKKKNICPDCSISIPYLAASQTVWMSIFSVLLCKLSIQSIYLLSLLQYDECFLWGTHTSWKKWFEPCNSSWCAGKWLLPGRFLLIRFIITLQSKDYWGIFVQDLGAISNAMFRLKGPTMLQNSYPPAFPLKHQQKDMRLALALGDENAVSMPVAAASNEVILFLSYFLSLLKKTDNQKMVL